MILQPLEADISELATATSGPFGAPTSQMLFKLFNVPLKSGCLSPIKHLKTQVSEILKDGLPLYFVNLNVPDLVWESSGQEQPDKNSIITALDSAEKRD